MLKKYTKKPETPEGHQYRHREEATEEDWQLYNDVREEMQERFDFMWSGFSGRLIKGNSYSSSHKNERQYTWCAYVTRKLAEHRPKTILDIGSWVQYVFGLAASGADVTMIDIREHPQASIFPFRYQQADVADLPFEDDSFAAVTIWQNLHHVGIGYNQDFDPDKAQKAIREVTRVLEPGGIALLSTRVKKGKSCLIYGGIRVTGIEHLEEMIADAGLTSEDVHYKSGRDFREISRDELTEEVGLRESQRGDFILATLRKPTSS